MRNILQRMGTVFLAVLLVCTLCPEIGVGSAQAATVTLKDPVTDGNTVTWDCVWFGSYPQTEILPGSSEYTALASASGWSNDEIRISGEKYRRVRKTDAEDSTHSGEAGYYNWGSVSDWHYFRYEPMKWRVLEAGNELFLMADEAVDAKNILSNDSNIWMHHSLRKFLNSTSLEQHGFLASAFTTEEQAGIIQTDVENQYTPDGIYNLPTMDKVYLLWGFELDEKFDDTAVQHGFLSDAHRICRPTEYAKAMGVYYGTGSCGWWSRMLAYEDGGTPYLGVYGVDENGEFGYYEGWYYDEQDPQGIRPVLHLDASADSIYSYAGTVSSDGTSNEDNAAMGNQTGGSSNTGTSNVNNANVGNSSQNSSITSGGSNDGISSGVGSELKRIKIKSVAASGNRTVKVTVKRDKNASGYQIQYSTSKKFKKKKTKTIILKKNKKTSKVIKKLQTGKKYYFRARSFKKSKSGGTIIRTYGKWSKIKTKMVR